jgi:hypothetical protein
MGFKQEHCWWAAKMYGLEQIMGYESYDLRQLRLYTKKGL